MSRISRTTVILLAAGLVLAGCATPGKRLPEGDETWGFGPSDGEWPAKLIYGLEETDIVSLGFTCVPRSGVATVMVFVGDDERTWPDRLRLQSGSESQTLNLVPPAESDVPVVEASINAASPVATAFASTGRLTSVLYDVHRRVDARGDSQRRDVEAFWRVCAKRP
ncbi:MULTISPECIES: hypothetical protein [unclassified Caulobacter]|uniref:hypothetical protein n=1 Tax=unclassified Caulobacter TaxID=2648921 RepID=UPI000D38B55C|nr:MULTISPECIES: hypothetical protein [unclassified Caulobacter]PTS83894.1 hypothetical protein DBR21_16195 [Caulobacter sp. HMWF009]